MCKRKLGKNLIRGKKENCLAREALYDKEEDMKGQQAHRKMVDERQMKRKGTGSGHYSLKIKIKGNI